jgi:hypothetical protein
MGYTLRLLAVCVVAAMFSGFSFPAKADSASFKVLEIKKRVDFILAVGTPVNVNGKDEFKEKTHATITVGQNDTPTTLATQIVQKIGNGAMLDPKDNTNVLIPATADITTFGTEAEAVNIVKFESDVRKVHGFIPPPNTELVAQLSFGPNLSNGQDTLVTAADLTIGFAAGLIPPVSFTAQAGIDITALANLTNSELDIAGYLTSMPDSTDIFIFAQGAGANAESEIDYIFDPLGDVGSQGIFTVLSVVVPEPSSITVLSTFVGFVAILLLFRTRDSWLLGEL